MSKKKHSPKELHPNEHLKRERALRCWRLQDVADRLYALCVQDDPTCALIAPDTVGRWERGFNIPSAYYQQKLCILFAKTGTELGLLSTPYDVIPPASQQEAARDSASKPSVLETLLKENKETTVLVIIQRGEVSTIRIPRRQEEVAIGPPGQVQESDEMNTIPTRRELLGVGAEVGTAFALPGVLDADQVKRLVWMAEQPSRLDMETLSDLEAITAHHWRLYVKASSKCDLLPAVVGHFQTISGFLLSSLPTPIAQRLSSLASQQAQIVGEIYFDLHKFDKAFSYLKVALETAHRANNEACYSVSLARLSLLFTYSNQPQEALPYLLAANRPVTQNATITTKSWLAAMEAEAHANQFRATIVRSSSMCLQALERAEAVGSQPKAGDDPYGTGFSAGNLAAFKGVCYLRLRQPENAQAVLHAALKETPSLTEHRAAIILTDLAEAYVQQGEIEEACQHARHALEITLQTKSLHSLQRVETLRPQLEGWASTSYVQDVDDVLLMTRLRMT